MTRFVVNGRFLGVSPPTGIQRVARSLLAATAPLLDDRLTVVAPRGVDDPLVDLHRGRWRGPISGLAWEQVVLPVAGRRSVVVSLANTGPIVTHRSAVLVHDLAPLVEPAWFHPRMRQYARITLLAARRAELVVAVSHHVAGVLATHGVDIDRVRVVHPCVDDGVRPASGAEVDAVRNRFGIHGPYVVHVGVHDPRKNAAFLARAHLDAVRRAEHQLVLVGAPHHNLAAVELPRAPSIIATGRVDDRTLRALLTGASALAYPSIEEGFGLPPLEAQACGTPAVISDIPALRESAGPTARRVPLDDTAAWSDALERAVRGELLPPTAPIRGWQQAAAQFVDALGDIG